MCLRSCWQLQNLGTWSGQQASRKELEDGGSKRPSPTPRPASHLSRRTLMRSSPSLILRDDEGGDVPVSGCGIDCAMTDILHDSFRNKASSKEGVDALNIHALVMLFVIFFVSAAAAANILFVGNSFTHGNVQPARSYNKDAVTDVNNKGYGGVPGIFKKLAGAQYNVTIEAISGQTLQYHLNNRANVLKNKKWDVVVLQEYSTGPLPKARGGKPEAFRKGAKDIVDLVRKNAGKDTKIWLYETWARPDQVYPAGAAYKGVKNALQAMQRDLHNAYAKLAKELGVKGVVPVGDVFLKAVDAGFADANPYNGIARGRRNLWAKDNYHASKYGSYLSAVTFYAKVTGRDPRKLPTGEKSAARALGIGAADAKRLHELAPRPATKPKKAGMVAGKKSRLAISDDDEPMGKSTRSVDSV
ncbi:hypothetical protein AURDEDRAFT_121381 [Auricularia subglabra TFB-10046 SS5]|nr:hypothetical protein AURDEDRAFT_121381 [Auricularia subglabra TFB-10046 SS5]